MGNICKKPYDPPPPYEYEIQNIKPPCEIDKLLNIFDNSNDEQVKDVVIRSKMLIELIISINNGRRYN